MLLMGLFTFWCFLKKICTSVEVPKIRLISTALRKPSITPRSIQFSIEDKKNAPHMTYNLGQPEFPKKNPTRSLLSSKIIKSVLLLKLK